MITVYVWSFRGKNEAWGHASLLVGHTYISWWPQQPGQVPSKIHANIYASHPFRNRTYASDVSAEGQSPDNTVQLDGLNESAITDWWQSFGLVRDGIELQGPLPAWQTLNQNCSNVVAMALQIGGGDRYASWSKSWNIVWTPADVLEYARSIQRGILSEQAKASKS